VSGAPAVKSWWLVALASVAMAAVLWPYRGVVPVMDGWGFARCIVDAPLVATQCLGHASLGWTSLMAVSKLGTLPGATELFAPSLLFGVIAIAGWARLLDALLPESDARLERLLLLAIFVLHPGVLSTVLQPNVDVATMAWGMWMLDGVARGSVLQVAIAGGLVAWSKESGVALYGAAAAEQIGRAHV